jgi:GAF domain-containing protein
MAKALIGYLNSDRHTDRLAVENARLRARVGELENLVLRLKEENDALVASRAAALLDLDTPEMDASMDVQEMQPA